MSFRKEGEQSYEWRKWSAAHRDQLLETGLPSWIHESKRFWFYFMEHGDIPEFEGVPGFQLRQLQARQAQQLLAFLKDHAQIKDSFAQRDLEAYIEKDLRGNR